MAETERAIGVVGVSRLEPVGVEGEVAELGDAAAGTADVDVDAASAAAADEVLGSFGSKGENNSEFLFVLAPTTSGNDLRVSTSLWPSKDMTEMEGAGSGDGSNEEQLTFWKTIQTSSVTPN